MDIERAPEERIPAVAAKTELIRCSSCHRELRSPADWICGDRDLLCDVCYQNLLNPNKKINFEH
jgi:formylmethanofuran dehydrogenase subunit E